MAPKLPDVIWAQRKQNVFVTIDLPNVTASTATIELKEDSIHFLGKGGIDQSEYEVTVKLYKPVDTEKSNYTVKARGVLFVLEKKEEEWWPRLATEKARNIKVDWENWKDEDEADEADQMPNDFDMSQFGGMDGMQGLDFSQMGGMPGMEGMGGMPDLSSLGAMHDHDHEHHHHDDDDSDDDDDDIPELEGEDAKPE